MIESIKRDERIRLKDGRLMTLDAAKLGEGKYEVMLLDPRTGEEVDVAEAGTEAEALSHFKRLREFYHVPEPKGRYKKLAEDLAAALAYGLERKGDDDGGTCNFDAPSIRLPGWEKKKVEAAAKTAGLGCYVWNLWGNKSYVFSLPMGCGVGQGMTRTKAAEAMREYLEGLGYDAMLYCQAD
ncbi:hypothetical protein D7V91_11430 [bacterium 1xD42-67]|nr:hypothetical protein D7V91_11430 [bacterium 1xD42-67]